MYIQGCLKVVKNLNKNKHYSEISTSHFYTAAHVLELQRSQKASHSKANYYSGAKLLLQYMYAGERSSLLSSFIRPSFDFDTS